VSGFSRTPGFRPLPRSATLTHMPLPSREPIDLMHKGYARNVGCYVVETDDGRALFDCGPATCIPALKTGLAERGLELADVRHLLLSHIHLDHAGAAGSLVREHPALQVHVSAVGAPHLSDPSRLEASARRLYGAEFDTLWGELAPVPEENVHVVGDDVLGLACFPSTGHASHHVSMLHADGTLYAGDSCGVRIAPARFVLAPTPPPDIDLEAWRDSIARINVWRPETLFVTHFGPYAPVAAHLTEFADHLELTSGLVKASLARPGADEDREAWFADEVRRDLRRRMTESDAQAYEVAGRFDLSWRGLARYWRKKGN